MDALFSTERASVAMVSAIEAAEMFHTLNHVVLHLIKCQNIHILTPTQQCYRYQNIVVEHVSDRIVMLNITIFMFNRNLFCCMSETLEQNYFTKLSK